MDGLYRIHSEVCRRRFDLGYGMLVPFYSLIFESMKVLPRGKEFYICNGRRE